MAKLIQAFSKYCPKIDLMEAADPRRFMALITQRTTLSAGSGEACDAPFQPSENRQGGEEEQDRKNDQDSYLLSVILAISKPVKHRWNWGKNIVDRVYRYQRA